MSGPNLQADPGSFRRGREGAADELRTRARELARLAVERQYLQDDALGPSWGARGREIALRDAEFLLEVLAEAMALGDPGAFVRQLAWLQAVLSSHHVRASLLERHLEILVEMLPDLVSPATAAAATDLIARGRAALAERREAEP